MHHTWNKGYSVGVELFDEHHKHLFELIDALLNGVEAHDAEEKITAVLDELFAYTMIHLTAEERAMKQLAYPEYEAHVAEHDTMKAKVREMQATHHETDRPLVTTDLLEFILDWWKNHIMHTDKKYQTFFEKAGFQGD